MDTRNFAWHDLGTHGIWIGTLPPEISLSRSEFDELWALHPDDFHLIKIHGRVVRTPRWQQAFGRDYAYSGRINKALPIPSLLQRALDWSTCSIDARLNAILVNWYDGTLGHYIGRHHDDTKSMVPGSPIVTISAGETRTFRLRNRGGERTDIEVRDGTVIVMPYDTNLAWSHEVPKSARHKGRRISITPRAFTRSAGTGIS